MPSTRDSTSPWVAVVGQPPPVALAHVLANLPLAAARALASRERSWSRAGVRTGLPGALRSLKHLVGDVLRSREPQLASLAVPRSSPPLIALTMSATSPSTTPCAVLTNAVVSAHSAPFDVARASACAHFWPRWAAARESVVSRAAVFCVWSHRLHARSTALQQRPGPPRPGATHTLGGDGAA